LEAVRLSEDRNAGDEGSILYGVEAGLRRFGWKILTRLFGTGPFVPAGKQNQI
jgi:hypothetical protein